MVSWFSILVLVGVFLFTVYLLYTYASRSTPIFVYFLVFVGWFASFGVVALIPYDISLAKGGEGDKNLLHTAWVVVYWTAFVLCWVVLPMAENFFTSGEFTFLARLKSAVLRRLRGFAIIAIIGAALVLYLYFVQNLTLSQVPLMLVLMSNIWGLFLVVALLGYGLVAVPMKTWQQGSLAKTLEILQLSAVSLDENFTDSKYNLDQCVIDVVKLSLKIPQSSPLRPCIDIILAKCPAESLERQQVLHSRRQNEEATEIEHNSLVDLHKRLKDLIAENQRCSW
jgi:hypothetical protein